MNAFVFTLILVGFFYWFWLYFRSARSDLRATRIIEACQELGLHRPRSHPGAQKQVCQNCHSVDLRWHRL